MKNDVHVLYETSDGERFDTKEDADKHELRYAVLTVIDNFPIDLDVLSDLFNEFDIAFKGEDYPNE